MWYWNGMGGWGWVMMLTFWALVILLIVWIARTARSPQPPQKNALGVLEERFARGEIDAKEYEDRRAILETRR